MIVHYVSRPDTLVLHFLIHSLSMNVDTTLDNLNTTNIKHLHNLHTTFEVRP